jgi:hypothetical protein
MRQRNVTAIFNMALRDLVKQPDDHEDVMGDVDRPARRHKMTRVDAMRIWSSFSQSGMQEARQLALALGYKRSAIYRAIQAEGQVKEKWRHPDHVRKWDATQIQAALAKIETNPTLTLSKIRALRVQDGCPSISVATLHSYLDHKLIIYKRLSHQNQVRNAAETLESRCEWASWFPQNQQYNFIYIDEFDFNLATQRDFRLASSGHPAVQATPANRESNMSVVAAVQKSGGPLRMPYLIGRLMLNHFSNLCGNLLSMTRRIVS